MGPSTRGVAILLLTGTAASAAVVAQPGTIQITKETFPAGATGFGFTDDVPASPGTFTLADGQTHAFNGVAAGVYTIVEDDPALTPGDFTLGDVECDDVDSVGDVVSRAATVELAPGEVVTCRFRNVERAPTDTIFVFDLSGGQEVPPVMTTERGGCFGAFDSGSSELTLVCTHNLVSPTAIVIGRGAPGVDMGAIVLDLGDPTGPVIVTFAAMTPADIADLFAGNFYVEVATSGSPTGAIRGQILPRTVDTVPFTASAAQLVPAGGSTATASCIADLDNPAASLAVQCTHNLVDPGSAHLHRAPFGANGPVVFTFPSPASPIAANAPLTPRLVADFAAGFLYLDLHSDTAGEIRGQIASGPLGAPSGTIRTALTTSPAGGGGFGFTDDVPGSPGTFALGDGDVQTFVAVTPGTYTIAENDPSFLPGGFFVAQVTCDDLDSTGAAASRTATVRVLAGETVTCTFVNQAQPAVSEIPTLEEWGLLGLALGLLAAGWFRLRGA